MHGRWGEDGALQGYCDIKGITYTGPGIKATTIGFDKQLFKHNIHRLGIHTPAIVDPSDKPFIIKPNSDGSSIGIHLIKSLNSYHELVKKQPELLSSDYFFEEFIDGVEVTSGVIKIDNQVKVLPILQIQTKNDFYDLDAKYTPGKTSFILPANISQKITTEIEAISTKIYQYFDCKGCIRIDMMIKNDTPYVLEMNTNPGLTELSDIPAQAKHAGIDFNELMIHYLESAK